MNTISQARVKVGMAVHVTFKNGHRVVGIVRGIESEVMQINETWWKRKDIAKVYRAEMRTV